VRFIILVGRTLLAIVIVAGSGLFGSGLGWPLQAGAAVPFVAGVTNLSRGCGGQNAEVESASDPTGMNVYEEWIGCGGIGFARSADGGRTFSAPMRLPRSGAGPSWDPALALGPTGTVYAAFMVNRSSRAYPVVDISTDGGKTFPTINSLVPPRTKNFGDRDFIAVDQRSGAIYVTWDYGPVNNIREICSPIGSCSFTAGDVNVVVQKSADGGKTWGRIIPINPGFPTGGGDSAPVLVEPNGRVDVLYQGYKVLNHTSDTLGPAYSYFTTSTDGGSKWSRPQRLGPRGLTMDTGEWWIDGSLALDAAGNLYATWDTQSGGRDVGWLSFSTDHGRQWSGLIRVTLGNANAVHIVQVLGGGPGIGYVAWLTDARRCGPSPCFAQYMRVFSVRRGWLDRIQLVSPPYGNRLVWPGDTIGISLAGPTGSGKVAVSWGSAVGARTARAQIWERLLVGLPG
jgi:hypothetical protein